MSSQSTRRCQLDFENKLDVFLLIENIWYCLLNAFLVVTQPVFLGPKSRVPGKVLWSMSMASRGQRTVFMNPDTDTT